MSEFLTPLEVTLIQGPGAPMWRLDAALIFKSDKHGIIVAERGFITDFASVPRFPIIFELAGDTCHPAAVMHDWLYSHHSGYTRAEADAVLRDAAQAYGEPWWRTWLVWAGVRIGGGWYWERHNDDA